MEYLGKVDPLLTVQLWYHPFPKCVLIFKLLKTNKLYPHLVANMKCSGKFDYNVTPLLSMGVTEFAHVKPGNRAPLYQQSHSGWYIEPVLEQ